MLLSLLISPTIKWHEDSNFCLVFKGSCLKQKKCNLNFFIVYELDSWPRDLDSDFSFKNVIFGGVKLSKNANPDKYLYSGYCIGFDTRIEFSLPEGSVGKNVIIFEVDMSSSVHIDNKGNDILILVKGWTQRLMIIYQLLSINFIGPI